MNKPRDRFSINSVAASASLIIAAQAVAQSGLPYTIEAPQGSRYFGSRVASGGDANNDGYDDIFVVDDGPEENGEILGRWYMYSGVDGALMWNGADNEVALPDLHFSAEFLGDVDGDGCDDVILGRPKLLALRGGVDVFSGRTGDLLYSYRGVSEGDYMGRCVSGLGDLDHDDVPDFAFSSRYTLAGQVSIRSGRDGSEIRTIEIAWPRQVRDGGDIDGDLVPDVVLSSNHWSQDEKTVRAMSGLTGTVIWENTHRLEYEYRDWGYQITAGTDVTGDLVPDVLTSGKFSYDGIAYLLSGADGSQIAAYQHPDNPYWHHVQLLGINLEFADLTGDDAAEVVAGGFEQILIFDPLSGRMLSNRSKHEGRNTFSGTELAVGDVNGDGLADIIVGLAEWDPGVGVVQVTSGGQLLLRQNFFGEFPNDTLRRGTTEEFQVYSGAANRPIRLLGSRIGHDCTFVPQLGICIDLDRRIYELGQSVTDADGFAEFQVDVPLHAPLIPIWLQALDINDPTRGPITSNVMEMEIID